METLLKELSARQVPVWTLSEYSERTKGWSDTLLSSGALGITWLLDDGRRKLVAKVGSGVFRRLFLQEARALGRLRGVEGLQHVEAVVLEGKQNMIVSRFAGASLKQCVRRRLLSREQLEDVLAQVRAALERMHAGGVAHQDLHQENVCVAVDGERVRATVIDFGFALLEEEQENFEALKQTDLRALEERLVQGVMNGCARAPPTGGRRPAPCGRY